MNSVLSRIKTALVGGDERELILLSDLISKGVKVTVTGFPKEKIPNNASYVSTVAEACKNANVLILPVPGVNADKVIRAVYASEELILTEQDISSLAPNALIIIGRARPFLREWSEKYHIKLLEIIEMDEVAILNSIPTAEGAIQIAMEETAITIHNSKICVVGFGRVGLTLARALKALGAEVIVVTNSSNEEARAFEMGCHTDNLENLAKILPNLDICFNTIPHLVLNKMVLQHANRDMVIIDLATEPGGTDFEAANILGIKAILAPGLPGKVAPISAGKVLVNTIPRLIIKEMSMIDKGLLLG